MSPVGRDANRLQIETYSAGAQGLNLGSQQHSKHATPVKTTKNHNLTDALKEKIMLSNKNFDFKKLSKSIVVYHQMKNNTKQHNNNNNLAPL